MTWWVRSDGLKICDVGKKFVNFWQFYGLIYRTTASDLQILKGQTLGKYLLLKLWLTQECPFVLLRWVRNSWKMKFQSEEKWNRNSWCFKIKGQRKSSRRTLESTDIKSKKKFVIYLVSTIHLWMVGKIIQKASLT